MENRHVTMDCTHLLHLLQTLPPYVIVELVDGDEAVHELMTRDRPGEGRRCTNLTSGMEWFMWPAAFEHWQPTRYKVRNFGGDVR